MTTMFTRLRGTRRITATTILGLILVPLTVAGVLLWGLWNPTARLEQVTAAVVNHDTPVKVDGRTVPLGRLLAAELIAGENAHNFTWVLTDAEDAQNGLDTGRYASVVTIPEDFSHAATSLSRDNNKPEVATIDVAEGNRGRLIDTALSNIVTTTATDLLNQRLGEQFVNGMFGGMNELGDGITDASQGAQQLATGSTKLNSGAVQLAQGSHTFAGGVRELSGGAAQLSTGTVALGEGAGKLVNGTSELSAGVNAYTSGARTLADSYTPLRAGATGAAQQLKTTIIALTQLQNESQHPQTQLETGLKDAGYSVQAFGASIPTLVADCYASGADPSFCDTLSTELATQAGQIGAGVNSAVSGATDLATAMGAFNQAISGATPPTPGVDPVQQLDTLIVGLAEYGTGLTDFAEQGRGLQTGANSLSSGAAELSAGVNDLARGASQLSGGVTALSETAPSLASGAEAVAQGTSSAATGTEKLADGLTQISEQVPHYSTHERDRIAQTAVRPVEAHGPTGELFNASGVPLFAAVALWAGALALFLILAPLWRRTRQAARSIGWITGRSAITAIGLGAAQGVLAGVSLPVALNYDFDQGARFLALAVVAGVCFALLAQGLSALLGGFGRFITFTVLVVTFAVGIVSTVPTPLATLGDASPVGVALAGFQSISAGVSGAGSAVVLLLLWGCGGLLLTGFAVRRARARFGVGLETSPYRAPQDS